MVSTWCSKRRNKSFVVKSYCQTEVHRGETLIPGRLFQERYPERLPPNKTTIRENVNRYLENATSLNMNKDRENIDIVQEALENNPRGISCRKSALNLPSATFNRIVSKDLNWHPYRMQRRHGLKAGDFERRLQFCDWFSGHADDHVFPPA